MEQHDATQQPTDPHPADVTARTVADPSRAEASDIEDLGENIVLGLD